MVALKSNRYSVVALILTFYTIIEKLCFSNSVYTKCYGVRLLY